MKDQLERRLAALRTEYESGERALADLERREALLRDTLLRISGGIQVLEEELAPFRAQPAEPALVADDIVGNRVVSNGSGAGGVGPGALS